jgi:hypothetical protein
MDQSSSAGHVSPAPLSASVKSVLTDNLQEKKAAGSSGPLRSISISNNPNHQVADLFGRCFLRVCYWVEVFSSLTRKGGPVPYTQLPKRAVTSLETTVTAVETSEPISDQADSVLSVPPKAMEA